MLRCLSLSNDKLRKLSSDGLVNCSIHKDHKRYLVDMKSVRVLMNLLDSIDLEIAQNAAKILLNITDSKSVQEDLRLEGGIEKLLGTLNFADEDLIVLV